MSNEIIQLNASQDKAVKHENGQLIILAGPGSGKTRVIASKIAYLMIDKKIHPSKIFAATFTKKAANEMQNRVTQLVQKKPIGLNIGTFHSLCALLLRRHGSFINIDRNFTIYDSDDQRSLIKIIINEQNLNTQIYNPYKILNKISKNKNHNLVNDFIEEFQPSAYERKINEITHTYQSYLKKNNALDFDDLLIYTYQLLSHSEDVRKEICKQFEHVLIDEFQDTNTLQYEISKLLAAVHMNITVVGDPDQSIYSWRSAKIENINNFQRDYPQHKLVLLEQNYRSTKSILEVANNIIQPSPERIQKEIWTENKIGEPVSMHHFDQGEDEGEFIANTIKEETASKEISSKDIAVMYRTNAQSRIIEEALIVANIKYRIVGGLRFYERKEIKDLLAYLRIIQNENDTVAFIRIVNTPTRGIGKESLAKILLLAEQTGDTVIETIRKNIDENLDKGKNEPSWKIRATTLEGLVNFLFIYDELFANVKNDSISSLLNLIMKLTHYQSAVINKDAQTIEQQNAKKENINELLNIAQEYDEKNSDSPLTEFLHDLSLVADVADVIEDSDDVVTLTTLHSAKGLEFPIVFLPGVEEGLLPHVMALDTEAEIEEERRILYVGITRAKNKLYISTARNRFIAGSPRSAKPSRFLKILSDDTATTRATSAPSRNRNDFIAERKNLIFRKQQTDYTEGMKVQHDIFGTGLIVSIESRSEDQQLTIAFKEKGIKKILASHAPMEIIGQSDVN